MAFFYWIIIHSFHPSLFARSSTRSSKICQLLLGLFQIRFRVCQLILDRSQLRRGFLQLRFHFFTSVQNLHHLPPLLWWPLVQLLLFPSLFRLFFLGRHLLLVMNGIHSMMHFLHGSPCSLLVLIMLMPRSGQLHGTGLRLLPGGSQLDLGSFQLIHVGLQLDSGRFCHLSLCGMCLYCRLDGCEMPLLFPWMMISFFLTTMKKRMIHLGGQQG
mmetsp:Transcript_19424/g.45198  ORF Transcript_19424/g.45198 Transcript_19424/m.45198 type:complete len:214 (+) Transcript_19424:218-859(+)